jgi:hypothetical protein
MKKFQIVLCLVASIALAGFALFQILTLKNDGNIKADQPTPQNQIGEETKEGSEETRA